MHLAYIDVIKICVSLTTILWSTRGTSWLVACANPPQSNGGILESTRKCHVIVWKRGSTHSKRKSLAITFCSLQFIQKLIKSWLNIVVYDWINLYKPLVCVWYAVQCDVRAGCWRITNGFDAVLKFGKRIEIWEGSKRIKDVYLVCSCDRQVTWCDRMRKKIETVAYLFSAYSFSDAVVAAVVIFIEWALQPFVWA